MTKRQSTPTRHDPDVYTLLCAQLLVDNYIETGIEERHKLEQLFHDVVKHKGAPQRLSYAMALAEIDSHKERNHHDKYRGAADHGAGIERGGSQDVHLS